MKISSTFEFSTIFAWLSTLVLTLSLVAGCSSEKDPVTSKSTQYQVEDGTAAVEDSDDPVSAEPARSREPAIAGSADTGEPRLPATHAPEVSEQMVDSGDSSRAAELLNRISELRGRQPQGTTREEAIADLQRTQEQIVQSAEQILALEEAGDSMKLAAAEAKMSALNQLSQLGFSEARDHLISFCESLKESGNEMLVDLGRRVGFASRLDAFASGAVDDPQPMLDDFTQLIEHLDKDQQLIQLGIQIGSALEQTGHSQEAEKILTQLADRFDSVQNPQLASSVKTLREEAALIASEIRPKFIEAVEGGEEEEAAFLAAANNLLETEARGISTVGFLLQQAAFNLETLKPELASRLYPMIGEAFEGHSNQELVDYVTSTIEKYNKRSSLLGKPFQVTGIKRNGEPLDWSEYQGKVVLVDFWATWCGPCLKEMPNIKRAYEKYQEQGFEVVGVNLDEDAKNVKDFFSVQDLPWPTVVSADPESRGMDTPLAVEAGVEFIPFIVLVGRDGKVAALNVRGEELAPKLEELLAESAQPPSNT